MNVIISNRYSEMLTNLPIDIIKNVRGEYDADIIVSNFQNFFFNKMILAITAAKNYKDINNIQKLSFFRTGDNSSEFFVFLFRCLPAKRRFAAIL